MMDFELLTSTEGQSSEELPKRVDYVFQQAVTLTAHLVYTDSNDNGQTLMFGYLVPTNYLPLLVGMTFGIVMILVLLSFLAVWRYCWLPRKQQSLPNVEYINSKSAQQQTQKHGLLRAFRNGPWAYVSVGPKRNTPSTVWNTAGAQSVKKPETVTDKVVNQESPTYVRQISPSNSITINLADNNNSC